MQNIALTLLLVVGLVGVVGVAYAEDEEAPAKELKRGYADGKFVDEYFDIVYEAPELKEGFGFGLGGPTVLWSGKCEGSVDVELICMEGREPHSAAEWFGRMKKGWTEDGKERKEMEEGEDPQPWALFVQESLAGFKRHHGYAFYARGIQCFIVHAQVREKSETSGDAIKKALGGLKVGPKTDSYLFAHLVAKQNGGSPTDPAVLFQAGATYASQQVQNHPRAVEVLLLAKASGWDGFNGDQKWQLMQSLGLSQLMAGLHEDAIPTWLEAIKLSSSVSQNAEAMKSNAYYNLACGYSLLGRLDEAFEALKTALEGPAESVAAEGGLRQHAQQDPDLANMRAETERWKALFE